MKTFTKLALMVIPLIIGAWLLHVYAIRVAIPRELKLADCTNNPLSFRLEVPKGREYYLMLSLPNVRQEPNGTPISPFAFSGRIQISNEVSLVASLPIDSSNALLETKGFILTGVFRHTNTPSLTQYVKADENYNVEITLNPPPPPASAIWLHWLQTAKNKKD